MLISTFNFRTNNALNEILNNPSREQFLNLLHSLEPTAKKHPNHSNLEISRFKSMPMQNFKKLTVS